MRTKLIWSKVAAALAFLIGVMAVFAGGQVFLGILPDYYIINWLPIYNFVLGLLSAFLAAILIWKNHRLALPFAAATFSVHTLVMIALQTVYRSVVATDSIKAMTVRMVVWIIILTLLFIQKGIIKKQGVKNER